jgi:hypothetical protein
MALAGFRLLGATAALLAYSQRDADDPVFAGQPHGLLNRPRNPTRLLGTDWH